MRKIYIVSYDICNDKRLRLVYKLMRGYGDRIQYSVFLCELSGTDRIHLESRLLEILKTDEDQVLFIPLGPPNGQYVRGIKSLGIAFQGVDRSCIVF